MDIEAKACVHISMLVTLHYITLLRHHLDVTCYWGYC